ncbi:MAG: hypothetical protein OXU64_08140 [Gemmatimonadota bacterium]|nr:hypothetical protein [Gemmatimonadota bacterium]
MPSLAVLGLVSASLVKSGTPILGQKLAYRLPSSATAAYQMVDTTSVAMATPDGSSAISGRTTLTYRLTFQPDGNAVRASADLTTFEGQLELPSGALMPVSRNEAGIGSFVTALDGRGMVEFDSRRWRSDSQFPLLVDPYEAIFPRLPGVEMELGDSWGDTVTTRSAGGGTRVVAYTYTLVSDTVVDDRAHLRVAVSGDSRLTSTEDGVSVNLAGSEAGSYLWDMERGLVACWAVSRSYEGSAGPATMAVDATTRVKLEN